MSLTNSDVKKIAALAKLNLTEEDVSFYTPQLTTIFSLVEQMSQVDTSAVPPLANPLDLAARMRPDIVTEINQRELFQTLAPQVEAGLYLVPKVIEGAS
jgi:aspartyl-tRNA(Asn)/glutamyl-tRNA(Gln) amidotransferase subunit C